MQVRVLHIVGVLIAISVVVAGAFSMGAQWAEKTESESQTASALESVATEEVLEEITDEVPEGAPTYDVVRIVDGDTVVLSIDGKNESVRLIGVDTPELNDSRTGVQCFAHEAANEMKRLSGKRVRVEYDESQGERDKYRRILAYLYTEEGVLINRALIAGGFAHEYTYNSAYAYQNEFKSAEKQAREIGIGLWDTSACAKNEGEVMGVQSVSSAPAASPTKEVEKQPEVIAPPKPTEEKKQVSEPAPKEEERPVEPPPPAPKTNAQSDVVCSANTYNCTDFKTKAEAQSVYEQCGGLSNDVHRLDKNKDGTACDSLP